MASPKVSALKVAKAPSIADLADELGALEADYRAWKPKLDRRDALRKRFRELHAGADANAEHAIEGARYVVKLGAKATERTVVGLKAVAKAIGMAAFFKAITLGVGKAEAMVKAGMLPAAVFDRAVTSERTGTREIEITEKGR